MSTYTYTAIDLAGGQARGELEADSKQAVADQLRARGLVVLDIADARTRVEIHLPWVGRITGGDLAILTRQLATMVSSGMTILRALYVLEAQTENDRLREAVVAVRRDVEAGLALSDALERHPAVFSPLFVAMARAGEAGGVLDDALLRVADQLEADEALRRQVKGAMLYPAVIMGFALVVLLALVTFLVPVFEGVFADFGGELPLVTRLTVQASELVRELWWLLLAVQGGAVAGFLRWKRSPGGRARWQRLCLRVPFGIGEVVRKVALARWSRTFASLVTAGVPLLAALDITAKTAGNVVVEDAMDTVRRSVEAGGSIAAPLRDHPVFPAMVGHMVGVGEETGALDTMLEKIADFYSDQVAAAVKALTSIIEPVMIIVVGAIVGFIVLAMYLPMFEVYDAIE